jgi:hypothetical protein
MARIRTGAIVVSWGSVIAGREPRMFEVMGRILAFAERLKDDERIEEAWMFVPVTGPPRDTLLLLGETEELTRLLVDDEFDSCVQEGMLVVNDLSVALWAGGRPEALADGLAEHLERLEAHGLV